MESTGDLSNGAEMNYAYGIRPSISLKPGTNFKVGGEGTASNPFEVDHSKWNKKYLYPIIIGVKMNLEIAD